MCLCWSSGGAETPDPAIRVIVGIVAASVVASTAWRLRALSSGGAAAAIVVGTAAVAAGWNWGLMLLTYFAANILLSRIGATGKTELLAGIVAKGGARDEIQVLANGLVFLVAAVVQSMTPSSLALVVGASALAASTADTWATEIGTLSRKQPRSILTGRQVTAGESGGVTLFGFGAAVAGSVFLATVAIVLGLPSPLWFAVVAGGFGGAIADSLLGAVLQHKLWCDTCERNTEREVHSCGRVTTHRSGVPWMNNDVVNLLSTAAGAGVAMLLALWRGIS